MAEAVGLHKTPRDYGRGSEIAVGAKCWVFARLLARINSGRLFQAFSIMSMYFTWLAAECCAQCAWPLKMGFCQRPLCITLLPPAVLRAL